MKLRFVVQGLFEKSDSIGFDCVYQYNIAKERWGEAAVKLYAEKADSMRYPSVKIFSMDFLYPELSDPDVVVIYHYCDSWPTLEQHLFNALCRVVVRWHNNTPPWFFARYSMHSVRRTISGFQTVADLARHSNFFFACNSIFTSNQLQALGIVDRVLSPIYPASRYLDNRINHLIISSGQRERNVFSLLFVGRIVAHKGHSHIVKIASLLQSKLRKKVIVNLPGRADDNARSYVDDVKRLAASLAVEINLPGEVDNNELDDLYANCDAFICMSEHEGFGLPVYEAMARHLPVAVLNITAFPEIIHRHPLAFSEIDYPEIAQGVARLEEVGFRNRVLQYQRERILPEYTREVVESQLYKVISSVKRYISDVRSREEESQIPFEIKDNYVTLHDVFAYKAMFDDSRLRGLIGEWSSQYIASKHFLSNKGRINQSPCIFTYDDLISDRHIIFGPYMDLPAGVFRVTFDITVMDGLELGRADLEGQLVLDVCTKDVHSSMQINIADLDAPSPISLDFMFENDVTGVEFRIKPVSIPLNQKVQLSFYGAKLSRIGWDEPAAPISPRKISRLGALEMKHRDAEISVVVIEDLLNLNPDSVFMAECYRRILGRSIDDQGRGDYGKLITQGLGARRHMIESLISSYEARQRVLYVVG